MSLDVEGRMLNLRAVKERHMAEDASAELVVRGDAEPESLQHAAASAAHRTADVLADTVYLVHLHPLNPTPKPYLYLESELRGNKVQEAIVAYDTRDGPGYESACMP